jgi:hypothetical protein
VAKEITIGDISDNGSWGNPGFEIRNLTPEEMRRITKRPSVCKVTDPDGSRPQKVMVDRGLTDPETADFITFASSVILKPYVLKNIKVQWHNMEMSRTWNKLQSASSISWRS